MMRRSRPFFRWVGGKRRLAPHIASMIPEFTGTYHEPFLGSGALFLKLAAEGKLHRPSRLADANPELVHTFQCVRDCPEDVIHLVAQHAERHSTGWFQTIRAMDRHASFNSCPPEERAARFIYLTNATYNGNWRVNRAGQMIAAPAPAHSPRILDAAAIRNASRLLQGSFISCDDFRAALSDEYVEPHDFMFLDPPHLPQGTDEDQPRYTAQRYTSGDQQALEAIFRRLDQRGVYVVLSVAWNDDLLDRFPGCHVIRIERSQVGDEALVSNTMR